MVAKNTSSTRCFAKKQQLEDLNRHAASVKYKNKEAKKKFLQSLIGLKLNVPEHWWIDSRGNKLWKCVVWSLLILMMNIGGTSRPSRQAVFTGTDINPWRA